MPGNRDTSAQLGENLIACRLVTRAQWDEAVTRSGSGDVRDALNILSRARAYWAPESDRSFVPALTHYQIEQIKSWLAAPQGEFPRGRLVWNEYLLLDKLAAGGMGVVFKGWCTVHRRYVAIKRTLSDSGDLHRRLKREAELLRQLHHSNVAEFYAREPLGDDNLLVMEFVPGKTLLDVVRDRAAKQSPVLWESATEWAIDLLGALDHLNGHNDAGVVMVHRDIKPSNVMLRPDGGRYRAVLVDFGLARAAKVSEALAGAAPAGEDHGFGEDLTKQYQFLGTPEYAAPEQWNGGRHAQPASDVYSLGGTLYYALTGRPPFGNMPEDAANLMAAMMQMMTRHRSSLRPGFAGLRADVPRALENLLQIMLSEEPENRGDAGELRARFEKVLDAPGPMVAPEPPGRPEILSAPPPAPPAVRAPGAAPPAWGAPVPPVPRPEPPKPAPVAQPRPPAAPSGPVPTPVRRPEIPPAAVPERRPERPVAPAPVTAPPVTPPQIRGPEAPIYQLEVTPPPREPTASDGTGSGTQKRKRTTRESALPPQPDADAAVQAAEPPSPATAEVFAAMFEWLGAELGGKRRGASPRLRSEFLRQCGAWIRAFARPRSHPGRWSVLIGSVLLVGVTAGWDWAFLPLAVVGLLVVFALLAAE